MIKNMAKAIRWQVLEDSMNQLFLASSSLALEANAPKPSSELHESTELAKTGTIVTVLDYAGMVVHHMVLTFAKNL